MRSRAWAASCLVFGLGLLSACGGSGGLAASPDPDGGSDEGGGGTGNPNLNTDGDAGGAPVPQEAGGGAAAPPTCGNHPACSGGLSCEATPAGPACVTPKGPEVTDKGGDVLPAMAVWTVVWQGDEALGKTVDAFSAAALASSWWSGAAEYGVGPGRALGVLVAGPPPATLAADGSDYETAIRKLIGSVDLEGNVVSPPDRNTVFAFVVSKATQGDGGGYYHTSTSGTFMGPSGHINVPYIVDLQDSVGFVSDEDYLTWSHSHELVETATDPRTPTAWTSAATGSNSEIGDLCNDIPVTLTIGGAPRKMSRFWSAKVAATRTSDPCIPALSTPYQGVALQNELVRVPSGSQGAKVALVPFTFGTPYPLTWSLTMGRSYHATPSKGTNAPGELVEVTFTRDAHAPSAAEYLTVWVADPAKPNAPIPTAEWFGGLAPSP